MGRRRRALLSVSEKTGLVPFARALLDLGFEIVSTGGTAQTLREADLGVTDVSDVTGFPEILGGRVKTLHPKVHGGILAAEDAGHARQTQAHRIELFDLVVVNLYPFENGWRSSDRSERELTELIDIGGPALVRAAAKNHGRVSVVIDPADYEAVLNEMRGGHDVSDATRLRLAAKAFAHTARYDAIVAYWMHRRTGAKDPPEIFSLPTRRRATLRYGENHHQTGYFYDDDLGLFGTEPSISTAAQLHGKGLSYNNILDGDTALEAIKEFNEPAVVIIKHATPSGIAMADDVTTAWRHAYATDTYSPFGGVVALNRRVDAAMADELLSVFLEVVLAPGFDDEALALLRAKKNLRLLEVPGLEDVDGRAGHMTRSVTGGLLWQDRDLKPVDPTTWKTVTKRAPTDAQTASMAFAARCVRHVRSNAVVFAKGTRTVGIGGGQTARVDAVYIARKKGKENIEGSVLASDAFFPFRDTVDAAAAARVEAIVQPGGSIRDHEVIEAANEHDIAMVFSGHRTFRH